MNVTRLTLSGFRGRGNLVVDQFSPRLNILSSPPRGGNTAVSEGPSEGAVHVADHANRFALRRRRN